MVLSVANITVQVPKTPNGAFVAQGDIALKFQSLQTPELTSARINANACSIAGLDVCNLLLRNVPELLLYPIESIAHEELQHRLDELADDLVSDLPSPEYDIVDRRLNLFCHI